MKCLQQLTLGWDQSQELSTQLKSLMVAGTKLHLQEAEVTDVGTLMWEMCILTNVLPARLNTSLNLNLNFLGGVIFEACVSFLLKLHKIKCYT